MTEPASHPHNFFNFPGLKEWDLCLLQCQRLCSGFNTYLFFFFPLWLPKEVTLYLHSLVFSQLSGQRYAHTFQTCPSICVWDGKSIFKPWPVLKFALAPAFCQTLSGLPSTCAQFHQGCMENLSLYGILNSKVCLLKTWLVPHASQLAPQSHTCK